MFIMLAALLLVLWLVGLATSYTLGGFIDVLLLAGLAMVLIQVFHDRRPATE